MNVPVYVRLIDLNDHPRSSSSGGNLSGSSFQNNNNYSKLQERMRKKKLDQKAFSLNFELTGTLGMYKNPMHNNEGFDFPWDVRVSIACNCIIISDYGNNRLQVFDAKTKEFKTTLKFSTEIDCPASLCIEQDYDGRDREALLFEYALTDGNRYICKYDFENLLNNSMKQEVTQELWKSSICHCPAGIAVWKKTQQLQDRIVLVCDYDDSAIYLFKSCSGEFIQTVELDSPLFKVVHPLGIDISAEGLVFISQGSPNSTILILRYDYKTEKWLVSQEISEANEHFKIPRGLVFDNMSKNLLVCASESNTIHVLTEDGKFCKMFGHDKKGQDGLENPDGIWLNSQTGELYVCDYSNHRVQIFK
ncbi:hypothetical protein FDP41_003215 [Naegleria fowleri]|uniref:SMP-30/Gluconolactonase/LRE-like region domain-containing protein n=1 Tax=Naegleria fowleri TaxID=5763 RepID=A0A6A5BJ03_NAEFO|nr:uncharacterized protein FDP41_003215 [Naegleria fowleri]KAF0977893.1 hypothetical protein FDP41_003215 [Naegleria fowleri]CAG4708023.1 unnamed protein product [Naegleria fowleri]